MNGTELRNAITQLWGGHGAQQRCCDHFGLKTSRRLREYLADERAVPDWLARDITNLRAKFPGGMPQITAQSRISLLHDQLIAEGRSHTDAAAEILAAAQGLAARQGLFA